MLAASVLQPAAAAGVEVTLDASLPVAPTGFLFHKGVLYGAAITGVNSYGSAYQMVPPSKTNPKWSFDILCVFADFQGDGAYPSAALVADTAGNLYGTTFGGGVAVPNTVGNGTLFKLLPPSGSDGNWFQQIIYTFQTAVQPRVKLAIDGAGDLYLATGNSVLQFTPPATGSGSYTMAAIPIPSGYQANGSGVVIDRFGNLYGVAQTIATSPSVSDIVYQLTPPTTEGAQWSSRTLQSFPVTAHVGQLGLSPSGHLFGTTSPVGAACDPASCAVFALVQSGRGSWTEQIVHSFAGDPLGNPPFANDPQGSPPAPSTDPYAPDDYRLSFAPGGVIYGAIIPTHSNGSANSTIYRLTPPAGGQATWTETALYTFQGSPSGFSAGSPLYIAGNGTVYGTAYGGVYTNGLYQSVAFKIASP